MNSKQRIEKIESLLKEALRELSLIKGEKKSIPGPRKEKLDTKFIVRRRNSKIKIVDYPTSK